MLDRNKNKLITSAIGAGLVIFGLVACEEFSTSQPTQETANNTSHAPVAPSPSTALNQISQALEQGHPRTRPDAPIDLLGIVQAQLEEAQGLAATAISQSKTAIFQRDEAISAQTTAEAETDAYLITAQTAVASSRESHIMAQAALSETERMIHVVQTARPKA